MKRVLDLGWSSEKEEWRLLDHHYLNESVIHAAERNNTDAAMLEKLSLDQSTVKAIQTSQARDRSSEVRLELYKDPVGGLPDPAAALYQGDWLSAMAPVSDVGWMVIVQERRDAALVPVQIVAERASRQTWLSVLTTAIALMAVIWSFVWRAYSRG